MGFPMADRERGPSILKIDPDNYDPLFDIDFLDEDAIQSDQDLADILGESAHRRKPPRYDEGECE